MRFFNWIILGGILPIKEFFWRSKDVSSVLLVTRSDEKLIKWKLSHNLNSDNLVREDKDIGNGPCRVFFARAKKKKLVKRPISEGMIEFKWFFRRSRYRRFISLPIEHGIFPWSELLKSKTTLRLQIRPILLGIKPEKYYWFLALKLKK